MIANNDKHCTYWESVPRSASAAGKSDLPSRASIASDVGDSNRNSYN